jgi:hypothetical protein
MIAPTLSRRRDLPRCVGRWGSTDIVGGMSATDEPTTAGQQTEEYAGVDYCLVHAGIRNEDDGRGRCDFAVDAGPSRSDEEPDECDFRPLFYRP